MKAYSTDLRERIVAAVRNKMSKTEAAKHFKVSLNSVKRYVIQAEELGKLEPKTSPGRPRALEAEALGLVLAHRQAQPDATLQEQVEHLAAATGLTVSPSTICRLLRRQQITRKKKV